MTRSPAKPGGQSGDRRRRDNMRKIRNICTVRNVRNILMFAKIVMFETFAMFATFQCSQHSNVHNIPMFATFQYSQHSNVRNITMFAKFVMFATFAFQHLAKQELDWSKVVVTLADERWVPVEHADSNAGLLKQYLLKGPAAKAQFLSLYSAAANVEQAAEQADRLLGELPPIDVPPTRNYRWNSNHIIIDDPIQTAWNQNREQFSSEALIA